MSFPNIDDLFSRNQRNRFLNLLDIPHLLICVFIIGFYVLLLGSGKFDRIENSVLDFFFRQQPERSTRARLVVIEIDKESIQAIGAWPWPWSYHGQVLDTLKKWKAQSVVFDFHFKEAGGVKEEAALRDSIINGPAVYLPVSIEAKAGKKIWVHGMPILIEPENEKQGWVHSAPSIETSAKGLGHLNLSADSDNILRRVEPYRSYSGESYFYLPVKAAYDYLGKPVRGLLDLKMPRDRRGSMMIQWSGRWGKSFQRISYADLVRSAQAVEKGLPPVIDPSSLRGKICLIGVSVPDLTDIKITPLGEEVPSVAVQAQVLDNILSGNFLKPVPFWVNALCLSALGFATAVLFVFFGNAMAFIAVLLLTLCWAVFCFWVFIEKGIWLYSAHAAALLLTLFIFSAIYHQIRSFKERTKLFDLATRDGLTGLFVIRHFREILNQSVQQAREKKQPLSVILMDIDNFKKINDTYGHPAGDMVLKKSAELIRECFRSKRPVHQIDFAARYGGEEFIIMLRGATLKDAGLLVAERVRKVIEKGVFEWEGTVITVTMSLGVASLKPGESIPDLMVRRADEALYRAKKTGKNRVCLETFASS